MKKLLITGSRGQLGRSLIRIFNHHKKFSVVATDLQELDITDADKVINLFNDEGFDYCINCAAYTAVDKAEEEVALCQAINATGVKNLAMACKAFNCRLIQISTDFVFDGNKELPYRETDQPNPINVYGASKYQGEKFTQQILEEYFIIRTSWVYSQYGKNFVKTMLRLGAERSELNIVDDQLGSPTYATDLAEFILFLIENERKEYGIYHYCNKGCTSWYGFAREIFAQKEMDVKALPVASSEYKSPAKRPQNSKLDLSNTLGTFDIQIPSWEDSLVKCLAGLTQ